MSKLKVKTKQVIDAGDWDNLVIETYKRPYNFQQQDGCKERGIETIVVPDKQPYDREGGDYGVPFAEWLTCDPKKKNKGQTTEERQIWWEREFFPDVSMVANDLHAKGLLEAGEYVINIDW